MKKLFIYYSLSGNGDEVANYLSKSFDIRKVNPKNPLPKLYIFSLLVGGYKAMRNYKDKLDNFDTDISSYDEKLIGSPIWNDRLSSPINSVLDMIDIKINHTMRVVEDVLKMAEKIGTRVDFN